MQGQNRLFYGWFMVAGAFFVMSVAYAIWYAFPIFYIPILDEFKWSRAETASIISVGFIIYGVGSLIGGILLDKFGPRVLFTAATIILTIGLVGCSRATTLWHLYFWWGGFVAFGVSTVGFIPCNTLVTRWFIRKRGAALGIAQAGGRESFMTTPLVQILIMTIGWRSTLLVLAGVGFIVIIGIAQFLRNSPEDLGLFPDGDSPIEGDDEKTKLKQDHLILDKEWAAIDWTLSRGLRHYRLWALVGSSFALGFAVSIALTHQIAYMVDIGFSALIASFLLVIFGIVSVAGRFMGFLSDRYGREPIYFVGCCGMAIGLMLLALASRSPSIWILSIYITLFGFFSGLNGPTFMSGAADVFQGKNLGGILGFTNIGYGIGNALGAWFGGYAFDELGGYGIAFIIAIIGTGIAPILFRIVSPGKIRLVSKKANVLKSKKVYSK
jgi:MFS family permease